MKPRMARMRGVRAPHRRTAHTAHPPIRGCAAGCAVGGANPAPTAHRRSPLGGGWSADNGEPRQRRRTAPSLQAFRPAVTLSKENALSRFRASPDPHAPACRPERAAQGPARGPLGRCSSVHLYRCRPYAASGVPFTGQIARSRCSSPPGGVVRPRRVVRFARLMHRRVRAFWWTFGPRRLRRHQIPPGLLPRATI